MLGVTIRETSGFVFVENRLCAHIVSGTYGGPISPRSPGGEMSTSYTEVSFATFRATASRGIQSFELALGIPQEKRASSKVQSEGKAFCMCASAKSTSGRFLINVP